MALVDKTGAFGVTIRIQAEDDSHSFAPVSALCVRVEQAHIDHEMALVVAREVVAIRWAILKGGDGHRRTFDYG